MIKPQWLRNYRVIILFLLASLMTFVISACNTQSSKVSIQSNDLSQTECRTIEHAMGETCIPIVPQRLATLSEFTLHHALVLGVNPIGNADHGWRDAVPGYLIDRKSEIEKIEDLGTDKQPDLEKILELKPDLIMGPLWNREVYPLLSQIAPTVMDRLESTGNDGWREHFSFVAEALGKEEAAQQAWDSYYQRIEELKLALGNQYNDQTVSIMTVAYDFENNASSKDSFIGSIFDDIGLQLTESQNVNKRGGWLPFSTENIVDFFDGDILFATIIDDADRRKFEELQSGPFWNKLKAVQKGNVYVVDSLTWQGGNLLAANAVIDDLYEYLVNEDRRT